MNIKKTSFLFVVIVAMAIPVYAQSNTLEGFGITIPVAPPITNAPATNGPTGSVTQDLQFAGQDLYQDFLNAKPFTTNGNATLRIGGGINLASHKPIFAALVTVPVSDHVGIGGVIAYKDGELYEGGANLTLGMTNNWPVIGEVTAFAADGVIYNFRTREPANYAATGLDKELLSSSRFDIGVGGVIANTSDEPGIDLMAGIHFTYFWSARKLSQ